MWILKESRHENKIEMRHALVKKELVDGKEEMNIAPEIKGEKKIEH